MHVIDSNWTSVDSDDTPASCDDNQILNGLTVPNGMYICGDKNVTFIPHHFGFTDINITNQNGLAGAGTNTFTYLANLDDTNESTFAMTGRIQTTIVAQNESNGTTKNFDSSNGFYSNSIELNSSITHTTPNGTILTAQTTSIDNAKLGGFTNGEKILSWDDSNLSQVLRFNFTRTTNTAINPFVLNASDVTLNASADYPSSTNITGTDIGTGDGNTTFVYGRTNAPRTSFVGDTGTVSIYYEMFCTPSTVDSFGVTCTKSLLPVTNPNYSDDPRWYINTQHTALSQGIAGNITQKNASDVNGTNVTTAPTNGVSTTNVNYHDNSKGYPYKTTMENNASSWLLYNKYDSTDDKNEFEVEFTKAASQWSGSHDTNNTTSTKASSWTNKRFSW